MNLSQLRQVVSVWVDDIANGYFTTAQIDVYLNNAQREVQKLLLNAGTAWYTKCATTTLVANSGCYYLPEDFLKLHKLDVIVSGTLPSNEVRRTLVHLTPQEASGVNYGYACPNAYFLKKNSIEIRPYPDLGYEVEMLYSYLVSDMTLDTDTPDVPTQYQELVAILATIDCFLRDQRDPSAFLAKKDSYIALMKQDAQQRLQDQPRSVVIAGSYDNWSAW